MKLLLSMGLAICWLSACVCIKFAPESPPEREWRIVPPPEPAESDEKKDEKQQEGIWT